jgi:hypothetical protein
MTGELNRELGIRAMLDAAEYEGLTPAAAVAAGARHAIACCPCAHETGHVGVSLPDYRTQVL